MFRLLTKFEVAELLHVSPQTVDRLRCSGDLRSLKIRGRVRFAPADVQAFLHAQQEGDRR